MVILVVESVLQVLVYMLPNSFEFVRYIKETFTFLNEKLYV